MSQQTPYCCLGVFSLSFFFEPFGAFVPFFFLCVDPEIIGVLRRETTMLVKDSLPLSTRKLLSPFLRISVIYLFLTNCGGSFFFFWLVFCFATELKESDSVCVQLSLLSLDTDLILPHFSIAINKVISHYLFQFCNNHLLLLIFFLLPHHLFFLSGILTTFYFYVFFF